MSKGWGWVKPRFIVPGTVFRALGHNPSTMLVVAVEERIGRDEPFKTFGEPTSLGGGIVNAFGHRVLDIAFIDHQGRTMNAVEMIIEVQNIYYVDLVTAFQEELADVCP